MNYFCRVVHLIDLPSFLSDRLNKSTYVFKRTDIPCVRSLSISFQLMNKPFQSEIRRNVGKMPQSLDFEDKIVSFDADPPTQTKGSKRPRKYIPIKGCLLNPRPNIPKSFSGFKRNIIK